MPNLAIAQDFSNLQIIDTGYIADYHNELTTRVFGSRKYTSYSLDDKGYAQKLKYKPNSPFNIGVGFNYKMIGLNLGFNLPLINDTKLYGKTRFIDLQTHVYGRKIIVDLYLQRYKGFYIPNTEILNNNNNNLPYVRPDLVVVNSGISFQYLFNWRKFTFRGAFLHNEVQLKSAGSPIIGLYLGIAEIRADSSILPKNLSYSEYFNNYNFYKSNIRSANFNFGYGYTKVLPFHFFITAAANAGLGLAITELKSIQKATTARLGTNFSGTFRIGLGYNSRKVFAGIHYVTNQSTQSAPFQDARQEFGAGNFRISFAHRFTLKKKLFGIY